MGGQHNVPALSSLGRQHLFQLLPLRQQVQSICVQQKGLSALPNDPFQTVKSPVTPSQTAPCCNDIRPFQVLFQTFPVPQKSLRHRLLQNDPVLPRRHHLHHARSGPVRRPGSQHRRPCHIMASRQKQHFPKSPLVSVPGPGRKQFFQLLVIGKHSRLPAVKAPDADANVRGIHLSPILTAGIQHQPPFTEAKCHRRIRPDGLPPDPACVGVNAAGQVKGKLKPFQAVKNFHRLPVPALHLPGKPHPKESVHRSPVLLSFGRLGKFHRIILQNLPLLPPLGRGLLLLSHTPHLHLPSPLPEDPGHGQAVPSVVAHSRHNQNAPGTFFIPLAQADPVRRRKGHPFHQDTGGNPCLFNGIAVIFPHFSRRNQIPHSQILPLP